MFPPLYTIKKNTHSCQKVQLNSMIEKKIEDFFTETYPFSPMEIHTTEYKFFAKIYGRKSKVRHI